MMTTHFRSRGLGVAGVAALLAALAGCSLLGGTPEPEDTSAADAAAAVKFVACLTAQGQTAKILDGGMVGLLMPEGADEDPPEGDATEPGGEAGPNMTSITGDAEGQWQSSSSAAGYPEDNGMRDAWRACEAEVPEFKQPEPDMSGADTNSVSAAEQVEAALAFAACARDNGYPEFPDPSKDGAMNLPDGVTEDMVWQLLEDCFDPDAPQGLMVEEETAASLDFDLSSVMRDFLEAHPEFGAPQPAESGGTADE